MGKPLTVIVDANNFIAIAAHANPTLTAPDGSPSGGLYASLRMLRTLVEHELSEPIERLYMVYDAGRPAFRSRLCETYKAERDKRRDKGDDDFYEAYKYQVKRSRRLYEHLGAIIVDADGYEADDAIGALVRCHSGMRNVVIVSGDKDLRQLIRKDVCVYLPTGHTFVTKGDVPRGYLLQRCMMGDTSDNIPGIGGIGEKRAQEIVAWMDEKNIRLNPDWLCDERCLNVLDDVPHGKLLGCEDPAVWKQKARQLRRNWKVMSLARTAKNAYAGLRITHSPSKSKFIKRCRKLHFRSILRDGSVYYTLTRTLKGHRG